MDFCRSGVNLLKDDRALWLPRPAAACHAQRPYLPVKIGSLDAQRPGCIADPALMPFQDSGNVLPLEGGPGLTQCTARHRDRPPVEPDVRQDILDDDPPPRRQSADQTL